MNINIEIVKNMNVLVIAERMAFPQHTSVMNFLYQKMQLITFVMQSVCESSICHFLDSSICYSVFMKKLKLF